LAGLDVNANRLLELETLNEEVEENERWGTGGGPIEAAVAALKGLRANSKELGSRRGQRRRKPMCI
jgi:hypothetical protein